MTLKTSLFNPGIYRATLRRYKWGGVLYAILLFIACPMLLMGSIDPETYHRTMAEHGALILWDTYLIAPLALSAGAAAATALISFRFIHSKKASVFVHSLPVTRGAGYISTLLAAFTLTAVPIVINGAVLALLSAGAYSAFFDLNSAAIWCGANFLCVFLVLSTGTLAAFLTGNTFAAAAIHLLLHIIVPITVSGLSSLANVFLYGYWSNNTVLEGLNSWNFFVYLFGTLHEGIRKGEVQPGKLFGMLGIAAVFYVAAYLLYRCRNLETAEDVAAYRVTDPIYKYLLTALSVLVTFSITAHMLEDGLLFPISMLIIVSAVVYFAVEMLMKKSLRVLRAYKGYTVFLGVLAAAMCFTAFTGFFGYETFVPSAGKVDAAVIHDARSMPGDESEYFTSDTKLIENVITAHKNAVRREKITVLDRYDVKNNEQMFICYRMKSGRVLRRRYNVNEYELRNAMDAAYTCVEYKQKLSGYFGAEIENADVLQINYGDVRADADAKRELLACIRDDLTDISYSGYKRHDAFRVRVDMKYREQENAEREYMTASEWINPCYKRTTAWLMENGYADDMLSFGGRSIALLTEEQWEKYRNDEKKAVETAAYTKPVAVTDEYVPGRIDDLLDAVRIKDAGLKKIMRDFTLTCPVSWRPDTQYGFRLCCVEEDGSLTEVAAFYPDTKFPPEIAALFKK